MLTTTTEAPTTTTTEAPTTTTTEASTTTTTITPTRYPVVPDRPDDKEFGYKVEGLKGELKFPAGKENPFTITAAHVPENLSPRYILGDGFWRPICWYNVENGKRGKEPVQRNSAGGYTSSGFYLKVPAGIYDSKYTSLIIAVEFRLYTYQKTGSGRAWKPAPYIDPVYIYYPINIKKITPTPGANQSEVIASGGKYKLDQKNMTASLIAPKNKNATSLAIPATVKANSKTYKVTKIAANACKEMSKLKTLTIGKNVKTIGKNSFKECEALKTVKGGDAVTSIEEGAFSFCSKLKVLPTFKKLTKIGAKAFKDDVALEKVILEVNVQSIGKEAYYNCEKLKLTTIKSSKLKSIGKNAYKNTKAKTKFKCPKKKLAAYKKMIQKAGAPKDAQYVS